MDIIKEIKIKQMKELDEFIEDYNGSGWVFRGQKSDYDLIPSALRNNENEKEDNGRTFLKEANDIKLFYRECNEQGLYVPQVHFFDKRVISEINDLSSMINDDYMWIDDGKNNNFFELLALAQHYGMKTRFLDWTEDIYVALYFACLQKKDNDSQNNDLRSVWLLNASAVEDFKDFQLEEIRKFCRNKKKDEKKDEKIDEKIDEMFNISAIEDTLIYKLYNDSIPLIFYKPRYKYNDNINAQKGVLSMWQYNLVCDWQKYNQASSIESYIDERDTRFNDFLKGKENVTCLSKLLEKYIKEHNKMYEDYKKHCNRNPTENLPLLYKLIFSKEIADEYNKKLEKMGYTQMKLFPGYESIIKNILSRPSH